jgi:hypothetical protein
MKKAIKMNIILNFQFLIKNLEVRKLIKRFIFNYDYFYFYYYRYKLLKSAGPEIEDDSTSSDSYIEKIPSSGIVEKYSKITNLIKDLNIKCKSYKYL